MCGLPCTSECSAQNWHCATDHNPLILIVQPNHHTVNFLIHFISLTTSTLEETMSEFLSKWRTNNIHCSPLVHHTKYHIVNDYHVGQLMTLLQKAMLIDFATAKWNSNQQLRPSAKAKVYSELSPGVKRVPLTETEHGIQGLLQFWRLVLCCLQHQLWWSHLLFLFFSLCIFLAKQCLFRVESFQTQGNIDSQSWGKSS